MQPRGMSHFYSLVLRALIMIIRIQTGVVMDSKVTALLDELNEQVKALES